MRLDSWILDSWIEYNTSEDGDFEHRVADLYPRELTVTSLPVFQPLGGHRRWQNRAPGKERALGLALALGAFVFR